MGRAEVVREIVEHCWSDEAGRRRLPDLLAPDYVHHTPSGDVGIDGLLAGLTWVSSRLVSPRYVVQHVVVDGDLAAAYLVWSAQLLDGSAVEGRGAYHCLFRDGLVAEDWDVFHPMPS